MYAVDIMSLHKSNIHMSVEILLNICSFLLGCRGFKYHKVEHCHNELW